MQNNNNAASGWSGRTAVVVQFPGRCPGLICCRLSGDGPRRTRSSRRTRVGVGRESATSASGRILPSFGNWVAGTADHSCREGDRRRMPDFHPPSARELQPLNVSWRTRHFIARSGHAGQPWPRVANRQAELGISLRECQKVPKSAISEQPQKSTKTQLALAVAHGVSIANWARTCGVPRRTAFRWAKNGSRRRSRLIGAGPHNRTDRLWIGRTFAERKATIGRAGGPWPGDRPPADGSDPFAERRATMGRN
jgi:hypothetical protein